MFIPLNLMYAGTVNVSEPVYQFIPSSLQKISQNCLSAIILAELNTYYHLKQWTAIIIKQASGWYILEIHSWLSLFMSLCLFVYLQAIMQLELIMPHNLHQKQLQLKWISAAQFCSTGMYKSWQTIPVTMYTRLKHTIPFQFLNATSTLLEVGVWL